MREREVPRKRSKSKDRKINSLELLNENRSQALGSSNVKEHHILSPSCLFLHKRRSREGKFLLPFQASYYLDS